MDVPRKDANRRKWIRRIVVLVVLGTVIPTGVVMLGRLKPAAPLVENTWPGDVQRGPMVRAGRGIGTLVAEDTLVIPSVTSGRVERILIRPGAMVTPETVILTLNNPDLEQATLDAEYQVKNAEAQLTELEITLKGQVLTDRSTINQLEADLERLRLIANRDENLWKAQLKVEMDYRISKAAAEQQAKRLEIEKERVGMRGQSIDAQLAVSRTNIEKLKGMHKLKLAQIASLKVTAGYTGVLQEVSVTEGQSVGAGAVLAKVVQPDRLKAELKVPDTQAKDVVIGQRAEIDTRNGIIPGHVSRIDPAAKDGTVVVDVKLDGKLPAGARPDLSVDGTIEFERLANVIFMGRPAFGQPNSTVSMFKIDATGNEATRVNVKLGRNSVTTIEVLEGLQPGDKVILSDMSAWDTYDRVRIK